MCLLKGYLLGRKGMTSFVPGSMGKASDDFTEYCLDNPQATALDAFARSISINTWTRRVNDRERMA